MGSSASPPPEAIVQRSVSGMAQGASVALVVILALLLFGLGVPIVLGNPLSHDVGWLLYASAEAVGGRELYTEIVDSSSPLIMFFGLAVQGAARLTGAGDVEVFRIIVLATLAISLGLGCVVLRRATPNSSGTSVAVLCLVSVFLLVAGVGYGFGQREHLTAALALPYLYAAAGRAQGFSFPRSQAIPAGVLAGIGLALKPVFLAVWLGVEGYLALTSSRSLWKRPEQVSIIAVMLLYGLAVLVFVPGYFELALTALGAYGALHSGGGPLTLAPYPETVFALVVLLAQSNVRASRELARLRGVFSVATLAFLLDVFINNTGWPYPWTHVRILAVLLSVMVAVDALRLVADVGTRAWIRPSLVGLTVLTVFALTGHAFRSVGDEWTRMAGHPWYLRSMREVVDENAAGGTITALSTHVWAGFPLVNYTGARWGSRFPGLWPLPGLYTGGEAKVGGFEYHALDARGDRERAFVDAVVSDLRKSPPDLLIVDQTPPGRHMIGFDYLHYFSMDERFRRIFQGYAPLGQIGPYHIYRRVQAGR